MASAPEVCQRMALSFTMWGAANFLLHGAKVVGTAPSVQYGLHFSAMLAGCSMFMVPVYYQLRCDIAKE